MVNVEFAELFDCVEQTLPFSALEGPETRRDSYRLLDISIRRICMYSASRTRSEGTRRKSHAGLITREQGYRDGQWIHALPRLEIGLLTLPVLQEI